MFTKLTTYKKCAIRPKPHNLKYFNSFYIYNNNNNIYRVFMMESTKSKQLLWDFLLKDHMVSWVNLIGIKRPFCETKSDFWYSEKKFLVHFGDISSSINLLFLKSDLYIHLIDISLLLISFSYISNAQKDFWHIFYSCCIPLSKT